MTTVQSTDLAFLPLCLMLQVMPHSLQSFLPIQLFLAYCFCVSGLIVNVFQLLTWIVIWPWNKPLYRRLNYHLATLIWSQLTCLYSWWANSDVTVYVDPKDIEHLKREYAMILVNHRYEIDWLLGLVVSQQIGLLGGTKIVGKRELSYIPILGWSWLFTESIFLRRIWESDKSILEKDIQRLVDGYPDQYYFNFLLACEGTRFTEAKRLESMKVARQKHLPELNYHLLPRTKGFTLIMQGAQGKIPAVYDFMLAFTKESAPPTFRTLLKGHSCRAHLHIKRIPVTEIPHQDEAQCNDWLQRLFQEKDRVYDHFVRHDTFDGLGLPHVPIARNISDLCIEVFWLIVIGVPSLFWFVQFVVNSSLYGKVIFGMVIIIAYLLLQWMINMSVIKTDGTRKKRQ